MRAIMKLRVFQFSIFIFQFSILNALVPTQVVGTFTLNSASSPLNIR